MDDRSLIMDAPRNLRLPLPAGRGSFILMQGVGGRFSHRGEQTWAYDWAMPTGTPVHAARSGEVTDVRSEYDDPTLPIELRKANFVRIGHADGTVAAYVHLDTTWMNAGERVHAGDVIGLSGNTGYSTQPHLHFHLERDGRTIPSAFEDVRDDSGVPRVGHTYRGSWGRLQLVE